jgi:hypothetical protein
VCGSFWRVDKIQNDVTMETKVPKQWDGVTFAIVDVVPIKFHQFLFGE